MNKLLIIAVFFALTATTFAKNEKQLVREGNKLYKEEKFEEAEVQYRKAIEINDQNIKADFNLADALYKKEAYSEAAGKFEFLADKVIEPKLAGDIQYNLGNSYFMQAQAGDQMSMNHLKKAVESYKKALKLNPKDNDARHNYVLAKTILEQQQKQQQQQQNKDDQKKEPPSEFAKKLKAQADKLCEEGKFGEAFDLMNEGLKKDKTVAHYQKFIENTGKVAEIDKMFSN